MTAKDYGIIVAVLTLTFLTLRLFERFIPHHRREPHNDVAGFIFATVSVVFAVPLAFVVVALWTNNDTAHQTTFKEANELAGIYWISRQLPLPLGSQLEHETLDYAHTVIDDEWPLLARHQTSPKGHGADLPDPGQRLRVPPGRRLAAGALRPRADARRVDGRAAAGAAEPD